jgi:hypothetical protein
MAAPLNTCTTIEQRGVVRFLWAKKYGCSKGYPQRNATLLLGPMSHTGTVKWVFLNKRAQSRLSMDNDSVMSNDGECDE